MGSCIKHLILSTKWCRWKEFGHILHILHDDDSYTCAHIFMVRCFMCHLQFCVAKLLTCLFPDKSLFSLLPCVVGCTCFVQNMSLRLEKLSLTIKFVFVDYSCTQKSYRYYHPACRKYLLLHMSCFLSLFPFYLTICRPVIYFSSYAFVGAQYKNWKAPQPPPLQIYSHCPKVPSMVLQPSELPALVLSITHYPRIFIFLLLSRERDVCLLLTPFITVSPMISSILPFISLSFL